MKDVMTIPTPGETLAMLDLMKDDLQIAPF